MLLRDCLKPHAADRLSYAEFLERLIVVCDLALCSDEMFFLYIVCVCVGMFMVQLQLFVMPPLPPVPCE